MVQTFKKSGKLNSQWLRDNVDFAWRRGSLCVRSQRFACSAIFATHLLGASSAAHHKTNHRGASHCASKSNSQSNSTVAGGGMLLCGVIAGLEVW